MVWLLEEKDIFLLS